MKKSYALDPPETLDKVIDKDSLANLLKEKILLKKFVVVNRSRTDGSNFRKKITSALGLTPGKNPSEKKLIPKGTPKILNQMLDVQLITKGDSRNSFNMQVWNRIPTDNTLMCLSKKKEEVYSKDIRFVLGFHNEEDQLISSIGIFTAEEIETVFKVKFTTTKTIKEQMILSNSFQDKIKKNFVYLGEDRIEIPDLSLIDKKSIIKSNNYKFNEVPSDLRHLYTIKEIVNITKTCLKEYESQFQSRKVDSQEVERIIVNSFGYDITKNQNLEGFFPDVRNQLLEIKIQSERTVDLGKYTPQRKMDIEETPQFTTHDIRYLIILLDQYGKQIGISCFQGSDLAGHSLLSFVPEQSWKIQRTISLDLFKENIGKVIFVKNNKMSSI